MGCCTTLKGIIRNCEGSIGGIKRAWGACYDNIGAPTITADQISALPTGAVTAFKEFEFRHQTGSVTTTITSDDSVGSLYYESAIVLQFTKQETVKRIEINSIAASDTVWIIEDGNGKFWYFGLDYPVTLTDGTAETGTARSDLNGYNITLTDAQKQMPYEVTAAAMAPLLGTAA